MFLVALQSVNTTASDHNFSSRKGHFLGIKRDESRNIFLSVLIVEVHYAKYIFITSFSWGKGVENFFCFWSLEHSFFLCSFPASSTNHGFLECYWIFYLQFESNGHVIYWAQVVRLLSAFSNTNNIPSPGSHGLYSGDNVMFRFNKIRIETRMN